MIETDKTFYVTVDFVVKADSKKAAEMLAGELLKHIKTAEITSLEQSLQEEEEL